MYTEKSWALLLLLPLGTRDAAPTCRANSTDVLVPCRLLIACFPVIVQQPKRNTNFPKLSPSSSSAAAPAERSLRTNEFPSSPPPAPVDATWLLSNFFFAFSCLLTTGKHQQKTNCYFHNFIFLYFVQFWNEKKLEPLPASPDSIIQLVDNDDDIINKCL